MVIFGCSSGCWKGSIICISLGMPVVYVGFFNTDGNIYFVSAKTGQNTLKNFLKWFYGQKLARLEAVYIQNLIGTFFLISSPLNFNETMYPEKRKNILKPLWKDLLKHYKDTKL